MLRRRIVPSGGPHRSRTFVSLSMKPQSSDLVSSAQSVRSEDRLDIWFGALSSVGLMATMLFIAEGAVAWVVGASLGLTLAGWIVGLAIGLPTLAWLGGCLRNALEAEREMLAAARSAPPPADPGTAA